MGAGMARSMRRAGLDVAAWNRTRERAEPLAEDGIEVADSVGDAVQGADVVVTMLFDVDAVLAIADEITAAAGADTVWLQASTVGPDGIVRIAEASGFGGLLDAPVLGTKKPAEEGNLVPIVSGPPALVERVQPVLDAIGSRTVVAGERIGAASALKLACNAWIGSITAATAQSVALAQRLGLDGALFLEAIDGGPVNSPYAQLKGKAMLGGDWTTSFAVDGVRKDLGLIRSAAAGAGMDTRVIDAVLSVFDTASAQGHGADDMAAAYTVFAP